jgi:formate C-acetyltransferase
MLEKGFTHPTDRVVRLKNMILHAKPYVESERAVLATEAYKENEQLPAIMRRAKVVEKIFNELPVTIRPDELIVGAVTINPRSTEICPEFSYDWVEKEFDTMAHRVADPFIIEKKPPMSSTRPLNTGRVKPPVRSPPPICPKGQKRA